MNFIEHLGMGQRPPTSHFQHEKATTEPRTVKIQRPKHKTEKPNATPLVEPLATERIQNDSRTMCAPSYANILMGIFGEQYIYQFIEGNAKLYIRYIDNTFILWASPKKQLESFISELNQRHNPIKFDYEMSSIEIPFLDTNIYIDKKNQLQTRLYRETTDRQNYLHKAPEHPPLLKDSLAYSQAFRIKRICSDNEGYKSSTERLVISFMSHVYDQDKIIKQIRKGTW